MFVGRVLALFRQAAAALLFSSRSPLQNPKTTLTPYIVLVISFVVVNGFQPFLRTDRNYEFSVPEPYSCPNKPPTFADNARGEMYRKYSNKYAFDFTVDGATRVRIRPFLLDCFRIENVVYARGTHHFSSSPRHYRRQVNTFSEFRAITA